MILQSGEDLDIQHFGGSGRVTQEADNLFAIQRRRDESDRHRFRKFLYVSYEIILSLVSEPYKMKSVNMLYAFFVLGKSFIFFNLKI